MKKRVIIICILAGVMGITGCSVMQAIKLKDCSYSYSHISDVTFMDMTSKDRRSIAGVTMMTRALMGKTDQITMGCTIHLKVTNPNKQTASMDRLFYTVSLDSIQIAEGSNAEAFIVAGESSADMPIILNVDIKTLFDQHARATVINILKNFLNMSDTPTLVTVNLRPTIRIAGVSMAIPQGIPISFKYGGEKE